MYDNDEVLPKLHSITVSDFLVTRGSTQKMQLCLSFAILLILLPQHRTCKIPGYDDDDRIESTELQELKTEPFMTNVNIGHMNWPSIRSTATLYLLENVMSEQDSKGMMDLLREVEFDEDLDSVDGMSTFEFYIYSHNNVFPSGKPDSSKLVRKSRENVRSKLRKITDVITQRVEDRVNLLYKEDKCGNSRCQVCYSFVRRYLNSERTTHRDHLDIKSLITVVFSLNRYGEDYVGGLYVRSGGSSERHFVPLFPGQAVVHSSDVLRGVDVMKGQRWSFIMWLANDEKCDPRHSSHWHIKEAEQGNPMAMFLHAKRVPLFSSISSSSQEVGSMMMKRAAESGFGRAQNEFAMWHREGTNGVEKNVEEAKRWFESAILLGEEDAALNLGQLLLSENNVKDAVDLFRVAARNGSSAANMNMGVAYIKGAGGCERNLTLAMKWFRDSNSANGFYQVYKTLQTYNQENNLTSQDEEERCWLKRAAMAGHENAILLEATKVLENDNDYNTAIRWYKKLALVTASSSTRARALSAIRYLESSGHELLL